LNVATQWRSNFTPEVILWPFLRMRTKSGQNVPKCGQNAKKFRFCTKPWAENLIMHSIFKAEVQYCGHLCACAIAN